MGQHSDKTIERWTTKRRTALVWKVLKEETSVPEAARQHGLNVADVEHWQNQYLRAAENGLRGIPAPTRWKRRRAGARPAGITNQLARDFTAPLPNTKWAPTSRTFRRRKAGSI